MFDPVAHDLAAVDRIEAVPTILRTIREATGLRVAVVARVLPDRWVCCASHDELAFGLKRGDELDINLTLCRDVRQSLRPIVIDRVSADPIYRDHPVPKLYGFQSYFSAPIVRRNGQYFGNLCGLDPEPRQLSDGKTLPMLTLFCELISLQLEAEERHEGHRLELSQHREVAKLREQFIAVLGHDVRNPLGSIALGTELLLAKASDVADRRVLERIRASTRRIGGLVEDVLDLARGRLGSGIELETAEVVDMAGRLRHVVDELRAAHGDRPVDITVAAEGSVRCDARRVEQLLSNLLANAVEHGTPGTPIQVVLGGDADRFELSVGNAGEPIPEEAKARLFQPYFRAHGGRAGGLGLGLYIVAEIARSHGGTVNISSTAAQTVFKVTLPRRGKAG